MEDAANRIVGYYERHALSWDADRRAAGWMDKPCIARFLSFLPQGATVLDLGCGGGSPVAIHMVANGFRVTGVDSSPTLVSLCGGFGLETGHRLRTVGADRSIVSR